MRIVVHTRLRREGSLGAHVLNQDTPSPTRHLHTKPSLVSITPPPAFCLQQSNSITERSSPHPPRTATTWPLLPAPTLKHFFSPKTKLCTPYDYLSHRPLRRFFLRTRCVSVTLLLTTAKAHNSPFPALVATLHLERLDGESLELPLTEHCTFCRLIFTSKIASRTLSITVTIHWPSCTAT